MEKYYCFRCGAETDEAISMNNKVDDRIEGFCEACKRDTIFTNNKEELRYGYEQSSKHPNQPNTPHKPNPSDKTHLIKHYLTKPKRSFQNIGRGINNEQCYIATFLEDDSGTARTAVVTSNRNIYVAFDKIQNQIKDEFNLNYREDFYFDVLDSTWSNEIIRKWLYENYSADLRKTFNQVLEINKKFIIYEDSRIHHCIAVDILRSYFFFLFNANSRSHIFAEPGSGKTNQCNIFRALMFNPIASPDFSSASIYRIIEGTGGTVIIDDFDDVPDEEKRRINRHIKVNYKPFKTLRSDGGRKFRPQGYDAYSHLVFNNTIGIVDDITKQRVITYKLLKHKDAPTIELNHKDLKFESLRDDLYICLLIYWKNIKETYDTLKVPRLKARDLEIFKPQLAIAKVLGDDIYHQVLSFASEYVEQERLVDLDEDWEYILFNLIIENMESLNIKDIKQEVLVSPSEIAQFITERLYYNLSERDRQTKLHQLRVFVGGKLSGYNLFRKTRPKNRVFYHVTLPGLVKVLDSKYMLSLFEDRLGGLGWLSQNRQKTIVEDEGNTSIEITENLVNQNEKIEVDHEIN